MWTHAGRPGAVKPGPELAGRRLTMTGGSGAKDDPHPFTDEARALGIDVDNPRTLAWMEEHLPEFRRQASGQRPLYWILGIGFVVAWPLMSAGTCSDRR